MTDNKKLIDRFFVIALFLFGLYYYCFRILGFDLSRTPGDYGDSRFINYILEHGVKWLKGQDPDFWRANFMYPLKDNVAISDCMAGALPIYALFRFLGINTETSYQLWWLSTCILNFWCCYFAFKRLNFNSFLSAIAAYAFAFGLNTFNQFPHLQFNYKFLIPVAAAALYLFLNQPRSKYLLVLMLAVIFQFYASAYLGLMLIYFLMAFTLIYLLNKHHRHQFFHALNKKMLLQSSGILAIGFVLLLIVALPYHRMAEGMGYRDYQREMIPYLPRIYSYFFVNGSTASWRMLTESPLKQGPSWYLHDMFPGLFCYLGLLFFAIYVLRQIVLKKRVAYLPMTLFVISLLFILLSSKSESDFSLFQYFRVLPGLDSMRLTSRFMIIAVFFLLWLDLYFLQQLELKKGRLLLYSLLALLVITDNLFTPDPSLLSISEKKIRETRVQDIMERIVKSNTAHKKIIACINTKHEPEPFMQLDMMLACQKLNLYTLNGYSSGCIGELCGAYDDPAHERLSQWLKKYSIPESEVLFITNEKQP